MDIKNCDIGDDILRFGHILSKGGGGDWKIEIHWNSCRISDPCLEMDMSMGGLGLGCKQAYRPLEKKKMVVAPIDLNLKQP